MTRTGGTYGRVSVARGADGERGQPRGDTCVLTPTNDVVTVDPECALPSSPSPTSVTASGGQWGVVGRCSYERCGLRMVHAAHWGRERRGSWGARGPGIAEGGWRGYKSRGVVCLCVPLVISPLASPPPNSPRRPPMEATDNHAIHNLHPSLPHPLSPSDPAATTPTNGQPQATQAGVNKRYRPAPAKTFQCRGFGECRMVFSRSEHLARHVRSVFPFPARCPLWLHPLTPSAVSQKTHRRASLCVSLWQAVLSPRQPPPACPDRPLRQDR